MTPVRRRRRGVFEGVLVLCAILAAAVALVAALKAPVTPQAMRLVDTLVVAGAAAWCAVVWGVAKLVVAVLRGEPTAEGAGVLGWAAVRIAALVLVLAPFLEPSGTAHAPSRAGHVETSRQSTLLVEEAPSERRIATVDPQIGLHGRARGTARHRPNGGHRGQEGSVAPASLGTGTSLVALASRFRRLVRTGDRVLVDDDQAIDLETMLLGVPETPWAGLGAVARSLEAAGLLLDTVHVVLGGGDAALDDGSWRFDPDAPQQPVRALVVVLGEHDQRTHVLVVPQGGSLRLEGPGASSIVDDALRVSGALDLGHPSSVDDAGLVYALAVRGDDDLVVCVADDPTLDLALQRRCAVVATSSASPRFSVTATEVRLHDGRTLTRSALSARVRSLLDGDHDVVLRAPEAAAASDAPAAVGLDDDVAVVRLLTAVPRVDGLAVALEARRERRAVELVAYLALHAGEPITGERLRVRVLGNASNDAASKTLFNVASTLRRALGDGPHGARLPSAGRFGHYGVSPDVLCDVSMLAGRVAAARRCSDPEERIAWLRSALELIESEPFATVLTGYDWFLAEGHLTRLQAVCEDAACELVELAVPRGLLALATHALDRARLVDPYAERLARAAMQVAAARQASFEAIAPAERSTVPSAPAVT